MQTVYSMNLWVVAGFAFVLGALTGWLAPRAIRAFPVKQSKGAATRALAARFDERVKHLRRQVQTLSDHSNEYTAIFSGNEWSELITRIEHYENVNLRVKKFIAAKSFSDAQSILENLHDPMGSSLDSAQSNIDALKASTEWEDSVRGMLKNVMRNLETAAHETRRLNKYQDSQQAYTPSRKRTSTLVTLADVKKALLEDESLKREL